MSSNTSAGASSLHYSCFFFFQAEDGIRDLTVTGVQTCALPIWPASTSQETPVIERIEFQGNRRIRAETLRARIFSRAGDPLNEDALRRDFHAQIGRASCRERV